MIQPWMLRIYCGAIYFHIFRVEMWCTDEILNVVVENNL